MKLYWTVLQLAFLIERGIWAHILCQLELILGCCIFLSFSHICIYFNIPKILSFQVKLIFTIKMLYILFITPSLEIQHVCYSYSAPHLGLATFQACNSHLHKSPYLHRTTPLLQHACSASATTSAVSLPNLLYHLQTHPQVREPPFLISFSFWIGV